jgi:hypothetical protein
MPALDSMDDIEASRATTINDKPYHKYNLSHEIPACKPWLSIIKIF